MQSVSSRIWIRVAVSIPYDDNQERRLKRYRDKIKQYRQNKTFQNNENNFYQQIVVEWTDTYQQLGEKKTRQFWYKIWER